MKKIEVGLTHRIKEEDNIHAGGLREEDLRRITTQGHVALVGKCICSGKRPHPFHRPWTTVDNGR